MTPYTHINDLAKEGQPPEKGILSRTLYSDEKVKAVIFGFAQGEELSEHTASMPAILHFLQGEAAVTLGDDRHEAKAGTWVHMPTGQRHSILAKTPVVMLLLLLKESHP
jgi:quercetin dioxygenase-like cupin family protein